MVVSTPTPLQTTSPVERQFGVSVVSVSHGSLTDSTYENDLLSRVIYSRTGNTCYTGCE